MKEERLCDGCRYCSFSPPLTSRDVWTAHCCDPDKAVLGRRRVIAVGAIAMPREIRTPVWCRQRGGRHGET